MFELRYQRLVVRSYAAKDVGDGAEIRVGAEILIGSGKERIRLEGSAIANGALLLRINDRERDRCGGRKIHVDKVWQTAAPRSQPGNTEHIVIGDLGLDGQIGLMDQGDLEIGIEVINSCVAAR